MSRRPLLPVPLLLALAACVPELPEEKPDEGNTAGDCTDRADNDDDGAFDCDDDGCAASPDCTADPAPPEGLAVAITPAAPVDDDALACAIVTEAVDPNGDVVSYAFAWTVDGEEAGNTGESVAAGVTVPGQTWTCTVTPSDGTLTGTPATASVTIQRENAAPSAPTVAITPAGPTDDDALSCAVVTESVDPDGDTVTYAWAWTVDGTDAGVTVASVDAARTSAGQTWTCSVTASDGSASSAAGSTSVGIAAAPICGDGSVTLTASGVDFVTVCAQTFEMGCTAGAEPCESDETLHTVTLTHDYYVGKTEVTQGQFHASMGYNPSSFSSCGDECPVEQVNWHEAAAYANAVSVAAGLEACYTCTSSGTLVTCEGTPNPYACDGYRLLTEAEWEAAARCGEDLLYAGSNMVADVAWHLSNSGGSTQPVGGKSPNACGLLDMSGNVLEWAGDNYGPYIGDPTDPIGTATVGARSLRGGAFDNEPRYVRVASRGSSPTTTRRDVIGFRLARTAP